MEKKDLPYKKILFVCDANTCRSPMAEYLLKYMLSELGYDSQIQVCSGGIATHARDDSAFSLDAKLTIKDKGIPFSEDFRSTDLSWHKDILKTSDLILTMTDLQKTRLMDFEDAKGKEVFTLKEFAGKSGDIDDPRGKDDSVYDQCFFEIKDCMEKALEKIIPTQN